jgi:serine/threonine-protein kinase
MGRKEKFGKFVLLEEVDRSAIGSEYRAAKLCSEGFEKMVSIVRLDAAISSDPEIANAFLDQVKAGAQVQNPHAVKLLGVGKVDASYYLSYEFLEGKSLKAALAQVRREAFPFSVDHALLIANRACTALEPAHGHRGETGPACFHGLVSPANVMVTYEGEIRLRGFGYWPARGREADGIGNEDRHYLSPEQAAGGFGDGRSDTFAVGALLYEMLTGRTLFADGRADSVAEEVASAKLWNPRNGGDELPPPIADILRRALAANPAARYAEIQEMRKALGSLLSSGGYSASGFSLAFFMHSVFREDILRESRNLKEERKASYVEYLAEELSRPGSVASHAYHVGAPFPLSVGVAVASAADVPVPKPAPSLAPKPKAAHPVPAPLEARPAPGTAHGLPARARISPPLFTRDAAVDFTFNGQRRTRSPLVVGGLAVIVLLAGAGGWLSLRRRAPPPAPAPPPSTVNAGVTAIQRVRELEEKLATIEQEKAAAVARAAEDARKKFEVQAAARGRTVDTAALAKAEEDARRKAQEEQEAKTQDEKRLLEEEQRAAKARLGEQRRRAAEEAARAAADVPAAPAPLPTTLAAVSPPPATLAVATPPPPVSVSPGTLVSVGEPGVVAPVAESIPPLRYPPIAERLRVEGTVELSILVDENGSVVDAIVVTTAGGKAGLDEAAMDNVKKRRYRPATKNGVPVKVRYPVSVKFVLPKG